VEPSPAYDPGDAWSGACRPQWALSLDSDAPFPFHIEAFPRELEHCTGSVYTLRPRSHAALLAGQSDPPSAWFPPETRPAYNGDLGAGVEDERATSSAAVWQAQLPVPYPRIVQLYRFALSKLAAD
jgi:hypothetical protein